MTQNEEHLLHHKRKADTSVIDLRESVDSKN
jgi:hypothetical protein